MRRYPFWIINQLVNLICWLSVDNSEDQLQSTKITKSVLGRRLEDLFLSVSLISFPFYPGLNHLSLSRSICINDDKWSWKGLRKRERLGLIIDKYLLASIVQHCVGIAYHISIYLSIMIRTYKIIKYNSIANVDQWNDYFHPRPKSPCIARSAAAAAAAAPRAVARRLQRVALGGAARRRGAPGAGALGSNGDSSGKGWIKHGFHMVWSTQMVISLIQHVVNSKQMDSSCLSQQNREISERTWAFHH